MTAAGGAEGWPEEVLERDRWGDVIADVLELIARAHAAGRLPRSLLLVGPPGMGRELVAVETAAIAVCPDGGSSWCSCSSCARVRSGAHPDVTVVHPQGAKRQIKIEQVQEVVREAPGRPFEGRNRVWIVNGAEAGNLGREAANAFLKTLEEPPGHVHIVLLAGNPEAVLPTIRSRCQRLNLPGAAALAQRLDLEGPPELAAATLADRGSPALVELLRGQIAAAGRADPIELVRAVSAAASHGAAFQVAAVAALEAAASEPEPGDELARLAADLAVLERESRAFAMNGERQLLARLLRFCRPA